MRTEHSAGAVLYTVVNGAPRYVLVTERSGYASLPKGHLEEGETPARAALREIREETGISALPTTAMTPFSGWAENCLEEAYTEDEVSASTLSTYGRMPAWSLTSLEQEAAVSATESTTSNCNFIPDLMQLIETKCTIFRLYKVSKNLKSKKHGLLFQHLMSKFAGRTTHDITNIN